MLNWNKNLEYNGQEAQSSHGMIKDQLYIIL